MADLPRFCRKWCPRPDVKLLQEGSDYWTFECQTCHSHQVLSKPVAKDKARYDAALQRTGRVVRHSWDKKTIYSFPSRLR